MLHKLALYSKTNNLQYSIRNNLNSFSSRNHNNGLLTLADHMHQCGAHVDLNFNLISLRYKFVCGCVGFAFYVVAQLDNWFKNFKTFLNV